jgi:hypothetical protein
MTPAATPLYPKVTAFEGPRLVAAGTLDAVALLVQVVAERPASGLPLMVFDDSTGQTVEIDLRGGPREMLARLAQRFAPAPAARGRPRLGVVAREVTLLPRHWDWLGRQPGGASVALRKLVEQASRDQQEQDRQREAREVCYRVMSAVAGNLPGFEEASRALFAGDAKTLEAQMKQWPGDLRHYLLKLLQPAADTV